MSTAKSVRLISSDLFTLGGLFILSCSLVTTKRDIHVTVVLQVNIAGEYQRRPIYGSANEY